MRAWVLSFVVASLGCTAASSQENGEAKGRIRVRFVPDLTEGVLWNNSSVKSSIRFKMWQAMHKLTKSQHRWYIDWAKVTEHTSNAELSKVMPSIEQAAKENAPSFLQTGDYFEVVQKHLKDSPEEACDGIFLFWNVAKRAKDTVRNNLYPTPAVGPVKVRRRGVETAHLFAHIHMPNLPPDNTNYNTVEVEPGEWPGVFVATRYDMAFAKELLSNPDLSTASVCGASFESFLAHMEGKEQERVGAP